jgi:deoxyribose-phosphate aldolase
MTEMDADAQARLVESVTEEITTLLAQHGIAPAAPLPLPAVDLATPLAAVIDHTLLKPEARPAQIDQLCAEAREHGFASVCVNPGYVPRCVDALAASDVLVCTVVGFPLGATTTAVKVFEAQQAIAAGAQEIDMVLAMGWLKAADYTAVYQDIAEVVTACHANAARCKVILETALLTDAEKIAACRLAVHAGADFVKTSTGFASGGATVEDVALMRLAVGTAAGVKASGGIRTVEAAHALRAAGATRIGASASVALVTEAA